MIPFTFTTQPMVNGEAHLVGPQLNAFELNPISTNQFKSLGNGEMQYIGGGGKFVVTFDFTAMLSASNSAFSAAVGAASTIMAVMLCHNNVSIPSSAETRIMEISIATPAIFLHTFTGQALVDLKPGDTLHLCLADIINGMNGPFTPAAPTDTICIAQLSLIANQAP